MRLTPSPCCAIEPGQALAKGLEDNAVADKLSDQPCARRGQRSSRARMCFISSSGMTGFATKTSEPSSRARIAAISP